MSLAALTKGVLVTGVGAPPGLGTLRSLRGADPALTLVAADINPLAGGMFEPGTQSVVLPSAGDPEAYRSAVKAVCEARGLDIIIPGSEAEIAALAPVARSWTEAGLRVPVADPEVIAFGIDKGLLLDRVKAVPHFTRRARRQLPRQCPRARHHLARHGGRAWAVRRPATDPGRCRHRLHDRLAVESRPARRLHPAPQAANQSAQRRRRGGR